MSLYEAKHSRPGRKLKFKSLFVKRIVRRMASLKAQKPLTTQAGGQVKKEPAKPSGNPPNNPPTPASKPGPKKSEQKPREPKKAPVSKPAPAPKH